MSAEAFGAGEQRGRGRGGHLHRGRRKTRKANHGNATVRGSSLATGESWGAAESAFEKGDAKKAANHGEGDVTFEYAGLPI